MPPKTIRIHKGDKLFFQGEVGTIINIFEDGCAQVDWDSGQTSLVDFKNNRVSRIGHDDDRGRTER